MFKQIFSALMGSDILDDAFSEFSQMIDHAEWMFKRANEVLRHETPASEAKEEIYTTDQSINRLIRSIRRKIISHLTINPGMDVAASMALMSIAKDAERIGDYCKNVFEVGEFYREKFNVPRYHEPLEDIRADTEEVFRLVKAAFKDSDSKKAGNAKQAAGKIRTKCDMITEQLLLDVASISTHEAVAYSLLARHYKRVAAHLANIASAVGGNIEDLDFA